MRLEKYMQEQMAGGGGMTSGGIAGGAKGGEIGSGATTTSKIAKFYPYYIYNKKKKKKKLLSRRKEEMTMTKEEKLLWEQGHQVAKTILTQIHSLDKWALGAWGAQDFVSTNNPSSLQFRVNGAKFKGKVVIHLNGKDLYDIDFGVGKDLKWVSKHKEHDIYAEDLVKILDDYIEK
jgi:hypothetical protein